MLSRDEIIGIVDSPKPVEVAVPERGGSVFIKRMNFGESLLYTSFLKDHTELESCIYLLSLTLCDVQGRTVLGYDDLLKMDKDDPVLIELVRSAIDINSSSVDADQAAKNS